MPIPVALRLLALSLVGFGFILLFSDYWTQHRIMGAGLLGGFAAVSFYISCLIGGLKKHPTEATSEYLPPAGDSQNVIDKIPAALDFPAEFTETRVLLVGFEASEQSATQKSLASWDIKTAVAASIAEAITATIEKSQSGTPFHAVMVYQDCGFRDILGIPGKFREHHLNKAIPLIFCLHSYDSIIREELLDAGFSTVLPLPIDKRLLFSALHARTAEPAYKNSVVSLSDYYVNKELAKRTLRILMAEDNPTNQKIIAKILERAGHEVTVVEDGEYALEELQRDTFDILLLDMHMPNMGGLDVVKALHFVQSKEELIPTIMLSAEATADEIKECETIGVDAFLPKPIETNRLLETIMRLGDRRALEQSQQASNVLSTEKSKQVISLSALAELEMFSADTEFVPEVINGFMNDNETLFRQMENALHQSRVQEFKDLLHAMKGSAASVGADKLAELCSELIATEQKRLSTDAARTLNRLAVLIAATGVALSEYLKARQSAVS